MDLRSIDELMFSALKILVHRPSFTLACQMAYELLICPTGPELLKTGVLWTEGVPADRRTTMILSICTSYPW